MKSNGAILNTGKHTNKDVLIDYTIPPVNQSGLASFVITSSTTSKNYLDGAYYYHLDEWNDWQIALLTNPNAPEPEHKYNNTTDITNYINGLESAKKIMTLYNELLNTDPQSWGFQSKRKPVNNLPITAEGVYTATCIDEAGNTFIQTFTIDKKAPVFSLSNNGAEIVSPYYTNKAFQIYLNDSYSTDKYTFSGNSEVTTPIIGSVALNKSYSGSQLDESITYNFTATDLAGNTKSIIVYYDVTAPVRNAYPSTYYLRTAINKSNVTYTDKYAGTTVYYKYNNGQEVLFDTNITVTTGSAVNNGKYYFYAKDLAGNI
ncbi:MAG: hypothetical protein EZS28_049276, partial [Streblomastix strix]